MRSSTTFETNRDHIMSKTHTVPSTTYNRFDLPSFIEDLPQEYLRMQAAQSFAWRLDTMIVQATRQLFKAVRDDLRTSELDSAADMNNALAETAFAEQAFNDICSDSCGPVRAIHELIDLRPRAHAIAAQCTSQVLDWKGNMRTYTEPTISDLFHQVGTMKPKATTLSKMQRNASRRAASVATGKEAVEMAQRLYDRKLGRERARLSAMGEALKSQAGALEVMFELALKHRPERLPTRCEFWAIDQEQQRVLIANAISSLERAEDYAESDSNISDTECDDICIASDLATRELKKVLVSPRFNNGVDGNGTSNTQYSEMIMQRNAKFAAQEAEDKAKAAKAAKAKATKAEKAAALKQKKEPVPAKVPATEPAKALADMPSDAL